MAAAPDAQTETHARPSDALGWPDMRKQPGVLGIFAVSLLVTACRCSGSTSTSGAGGGGGNAAGGASGGSPAGAAGSGSAGSGSAGTGTGGNGSAGTGTAGTGSAGSGSAGTAGSTGGGAPGGATGTAGGGGNPCTTALLCDDFESYTAGQPPGGNWTRTMSSGATIAIDTAQFRSGSKSVKFTTPAGTSGSRTAYIRTAAAAVFPAAQTGFYGRMMFRLESAPTASVHWTFVQGSGLITGQTYHALYRYGGQIPVMQGSTFVGSQLMANYETPDSYNNNGPGSDCWKHANKTVVPVGTWSCAEWQFDSPTNTMRFWLDGAAIDTLTVMTTGSGCVNQPATYQWTAPNFDRLDLGWESYQADSARTMWIDDVAISRTRIGCPAP